MQVSRSPGGDLPIGDMPRVAKSHGYDGYIRVKLLASWGKSLGEHAILKNEAFFGGDLQNLCEIFVSKLS